STWPATAPTARGPGRPARTAQIWSSRFHGARWCGTQRPARLCRTCLAASPMSSAKAVGAAGATATSPLP
ncbi:DNA binding domain, excisionase family, partial [Dysosmobacter welbionis]